VTLPQIKKNKPRKGSMKGKSPYSIMLQNKATVLYMPKTLES
jgi:hypothetical protein